MYITTNVSYMQPQDIVENKKVSQKIRKVLTGYFGYDILSVVKDTERRLNVDRFRLQYEMKKRGITVEMLCEHIGMSKAAFYRKCKGVSEFTQGEIQAIVDYLGLDSPMGIFFTEKVS